MSFCIAEAPLSLSLSLLLSVCRNFIERLSHSLRLISLADDGSGLYHRFLLIPVSGKGIVRFGVNVCAGLAAAKIAVVGKVAVDMKSATDYVRIASVECTAPFKNCNNAEQHRIYSTIQSFSFFCLYRKRDFRQRALRLNNVCRMH